jgi:hypothetical protein
VSPIRKRKKEETSKEDSVSTFVDTVGEDEGEKIEEEDHEAEILRKKAERERLRLLREEGKRAALNTPPVAGTPVVPFEKPEPRVEPDSGKTQKPRKKTAAAREARKAINDPEVKEVHAEWLHELRAKNPNHLATNLDATEAALIRKLLKKVDRPGLLAVIRLAVWDWPAIQEKIQPWYTAGRSPDFKSITYLINHLAPHICTGVVSSKRRVSEYRSRYIKGVTEESRSSKDASGMSLAERARRKIWAERGG